MYKVWINGQFLDYQGYLVLRWHPRKCDKYNIKTDSSPRTEAEQESRVSPIENIVLTLTDIGAI